MFSDGKKEVVQYVCAYQYICSIGAFNENYFILFTSMLYACTLSLGHSGVLWGAWLSPLFWFPYCLSLSLADFHVCTFRFAENCY